MKVYFVRHGESEGNVTLTHQTKHTKLSPRGITQAQAVAKRFLHIPVEVIIASDFERAHHTASLIAEATKKELIVTELLREVKRPTEIEGLRADDPKVIAIKEQVKKHAGDPAWKYSDEENFFDLQDRAKKLIEFLQGRREKHIAVVSHGHFIRMILGVMIFESLFTVDLSYALFNGFRLDNTGITVCEYISYGDHAARWHLRTWNDHAHLG